MWVIVEVINQKSTATVQEITKRLTADVLQVIKKKKSLASDPNAGPATHQEKQQDRRKETCRPQNRKRNKGGGQVMDGGCVISLIASTETGNGAVTHGK